jgi:hypothetical protein
MIKLYQYAFEIANIYSVTTEKALAHQLYFSLDLTLEKLFRFGHACIGWKG